MSKHPHSPPRVAFFDHTATLGGGEIALLHLLTHLDPARISPVVILGEPGPLADALTAANIDTRILPIKAALRHTRKDTLGKKSLLKFTAVFGSLAYALRLRRLLKQLNVDLLHTNSLKSDILGGIAARLARIPVLWHVRDRIAPDYLPKSVVKLFRALAKCLPTALIANSHATRDTLPKSCKAFIIHDGVPTPPPLISRQKPAPRTIGIVGRISPWKGQHIFLKAAALLHKQFPDLRFQIIGAPLFGEAAYAAELDKLIADLNLSECVQLTGFRKDIPALVQNLTVLVHASTLPEPFGQVIIEGMALGTPVIATIGGGPSEIIEHGTSGLLVPPGDAAALAQAVGQLLEDPEMDERMSIDAYQRVCQHFLVSRTALRVTEAIEETLDPGLVAAGIGTLCAQQ